MTVTKKKATPTPTPQASSMGTTTEEDVSAADKATGDGVPTGTTTGTKVGLTGVPVGTPIYTGEQQFVSARGPVGKTKPVYDRVTQYKSGDGMIIFNKMDDTTKAQYLNILRNIPGVYNKGEALTEDQIRALEVPGGGISVRPEDVKALEKVMFYADTIGVDYKQAAAILTENPDIAAITFGVEKAKAPKLISETSLIAEISDKFQNTFDVPVNKDIAKKYAQEVQATQRKNKTLSAQERENILLKYLENAADELAKLSGQGMDYQPRGVLGDYIQELRKEYYENGLPMDENKIYKMAVGALRNPQELQNKKQIVRQRAELIWSPLKEYIARGESVRDILSPYMKLKADIFQKDSRDINTSDMYDVLEGDKLKDINKYKSELYKSTEYKKTKAYEEQSISDTQALLRYLRID